MFDIDIESLSYPFIIAGAYFLLLSPRFSEITISIISSFTFGAIGLWTSLNFFQGWDEFFHYILPIAGITGSVAGVLGIFFSHVLFVGSMVTLSAIGYIIFILRAFGSYEYVGYLGLLPVGFAVGLAAHLYQRHILNVLTCAVGSFLIGLAIQIPEVVPLSCIIMICFFLFIVGLLMQYFVTAPNKKNEIIKPTNGENKEGEPPGSVTFKDLNRDNFYV